MSVAQYLAYDTCRCAGVSRNDIPQHCPMRQSCLRYVSLAANDFGPLTPWTLWLCESNQYEQRIPLPAPTEQEEAMRDRSVEPEG